MKRKHLQITYLVEILAYYLPDRKPVFRRNEEFLKLEKTYNEKNGGKFE